MSKMSDDERESYELAQKVVESFPDDSTRGTGIMTSDLARLLNVIDRLLARDDPSRPAEEAKP